MIPRMAAPQKSKATDVVYHPPSLANDGRTSLKDPGVQVTRGIHHNGQLTSDVVKTNDAVEPTWSDRHASDPDVNAGSVIPGATNSPR
jgi:hypothetical protein